MLVAISPSFNTAFNLRIKSLCFIAFHSFKIIVDNFLTTLLIINLSLYFLKFHPRKSNPSPTFIISVFSSESSNPLSLRNSPINTLTTSAIYFVAAVTIKSSQYLTKFTFIFAL